MFRCMSFLRVLLLTVILPFGCPAAVPTVRGQAEPDRKFAKDYATARALMDQAKFREAEAARRDKKTVTTVEVEGSRQQLPELSERMSAAIVEALRKQ